MLLESMILKDYGKHVEEMEEEFQYICILLQRLYDETFEFFKIKHVKIMS